MLVANGSPSDPVLRAIVDAVAGGQSAVLIAGAPGVGKTSILTAATDRVRRQTGGAVVWVNGGIVASEGHLGQILTEALGAGESSGEASLRNLCRRLAAELARPVLLAIDDFDLLVFKRERVGTAIGEALAAGSAMRLLATCHPAARDRLVTVHPFARCLDGGITTVTIGPFEPREAHGLVHRRAPRLTPEECAAIVAEAGGHPAALVFLARLAELRLGGKRQGATCLADLFEKAAELAGSVYAEPWAALGPQQRAILWQLGSTASPKTAAEIAAPLMLPAPQVSAQLLRLVDEGLVQRAALRAHFCVAPLLARWIACRAIRERHSVAGAGHG